MLSRLERWGTRAVNLKISGLSTCAILIFGWAAPSVAQQPFLSESQWATLREEASGSAPYENLRRLTQLHRVPATPAFDEAAQFMLERAEQYGLHEVHAERFPIDGKIHYGLMRSHVGWRVESARLWQVSPRHTLLGDWATDPIRLADYSHSADIQTALVDVGAGTSEADYADKEVRGKIVLADGVLSGVQRLAVMKLGAAGIVSDMPNQSTAWSGLDTSIVRWGHLDGTLSQGFAFMVSAATARDLRVQLNTGAPVVLDAHVQAEVGAGHWTVVTGIVPGSNPKAGEIVYSCHLDHQRPGANDNGSGCVTILESARVLTRLIASGKLPQPARTLRFIWGPEVEGTMAYLSAHPDIRSNMRADIHMDMVGGDLFKSKSMLHVTQTPWSLPTFITDVGAVFAETIRDAATRYTNDGSHAEEAVLENRDGAPGSRNAFFVDETPYTEGSDHDDYDSSTIAVPSLYLCDWPDIYIHTDHDSIEQIDATKLRRVALLGAASGYTYATLNAAQASTFIPFLTSRSQQRLAKGFERAQTLTGGDAGRYEAHNLIAKLLQRELGALRSFAAFTQTDLQLLNPAIRVLKAQAATADAWINGMVKADAGRAPAASADGGRVPRRIAEFGPLTFQNDDVLVDRLGRERVRRIKLLDADSSHLLNVQDKGALYAYEIVNFVDGKRSVAQIRDEVAAELGPLPLDIVFDYLRACEEAKIIEFR
jgi:aminopeptidase YwaD